MCAPATRRLIEGCSTPKVRFMTIFKTEPAGNLRQNENSTTGRRPQHAKVSTEGSKHFGMSRVCQRQRKECMRFKQAGCRHVFKLAGRLFIDRVSRPRDSRCTEWEGPRLSELCINTAVSSAPLCRTSYREAKRKIVEIRKLSFPRSRWCLTAS